MTATPFILDNKAARRVFLHVHALSHDPAYATDDTRGVIDRLGFVQMDSIQTVARAHHHILHSREAAYRPATLARLHDEKALFEHWTHDAAVIPIAFYPHWKHRFAAYRARVKDSAWWGERMGSRRILKRILDRIAAEGPLMARDFEDDAKSAGTGGLWGWGRSKAALEYLWHTGTLAIPRREGFQKVYDLAERVIPPNAYAATSSKAELVEWGVLAALQRLGFATPREVAKFWAFIPFDAIARWIERNRKRLVRVAVDDADGNAAPAYALPGIEDLVATAPAPHPIMRALNPFDPAIRDRKRLNRLFGFDYTIEIFVPEAKRKYGYYVYPLLDGDRLVGRVDAKIDRADGHLAVRKLWLEPGQGRAAGFAMRRDAALHELARYGGMSAVAGLA